MKSIGSGQFGKLNQHLSSKSDQAALGDFAHFTITCSHVDVLRSKQAKEILIQEKADEEKNKEIILILLDVVRTLARQSVAFRGEGDNKDGNFVQIINLLSRHCPVLKSWLDDQRMTPDSTTYTSSKSPNEMLQLLVQSLRGQICAEITSTGIFCFR